MSALVSLIRGRRAARGDIEVLVARYNLSTALHQFVGQFVLDAMIAFFAGLVTLAMIAP